MTQRLPDVTGRCPACGRGDLAPTADQCEQQRQRADQAEAAVMRAREACQRIRAASALADGVAHTDRERGAVAATDRILAALNPPAKERSA